MKEAKACENIHEIRECIDEIDEQILVSFGKRMEYVKEIVKFKTDADGIVARDRQLQLLQKRREWAVELGLDPDLFEAMYMMLINWNVQKEMEIFRNKENGKN